MAGTCPIVMAYWDAANTDTAYGSPSFNMEVIGFPSARGQMPVLSMTGCAVGERAEHRDEALKVVDVICSDEALRLYAETNRVISPSKNVEVECVEAASPLERFGAGRYLRARLERGYGRGTVGQCVPHRARSCSVGRRLTSAWRSWTPCRTRPRPDRPVRAPGCRGGRRLSASESAGGIAATPAPLFGLRPQALRCFMLLWAPLRGAFSSWCSESFGDAPGALGRCRVSVAPVPGSATW